jgi:farnesyl-diphosphate farnesyltransferase
MPSDLDVCRDLLPSVSRTFALTIPALPEPLADDVTVAYLVCRAADTIEDRPDLPDERRRAAFAAFDEVLEDPRAAQRFFLAWPPGADSPEEALVRELPALARALSELRSRDLVVACVREMVAGMDETSRRPTVGGVRYVSEDLVELERYCHGPGSTGRACARSR